MPAKSQAQGDFMRAVYAYKKGNLKNPSKKIKDAAKSMTTGEVRDFAKTKDKGLPKKVSENTVRLTEQQLMKIVQESVHRILSEAESEGWVVDSSEAQEAYNLAVQELGEETINSAIVGCLGNEALAQCLAYIFRMYDFRKWKSKFE